MQTQGALEQRQYPRRNASLVVTYRPTDLTERYDISQTRNISQGGMLVTTARAFAPGTRLLIQARLTFRGSPRLVHGTAEAVKSREIVPSLIYDTRVRFLDLDRRSVQEIGDFCKGEVDQVADTDRPWMWR